MKKFLIALALLSSSQAFAENELHLYNWNDYLSPEVAKKFEASCKCKLVQTLYGDNEEMLAKLAAGAKGYDMVVPTGFAVETLVKQGKALPLDKKQLPNFKNVNSGYLNSFFDKGNNYSVPYAFTTTLIGYNETKLKELGILDKTHNWALIFDPKILSKVKGRVLVLDSQRELMAAALMYLGKPANSTNAADWKAAKDVILNAKPYWAAFNNQSYIKELTVGNAYVVFGYSSDMYNAQVDAQVAKRKFKINFNLQQQGNTLSIDNFVILKDAPRKDLAYKFINFMLDGKNASYISNDLGAGNPNAAAVTFIKPELAKNRAIFPPAADLTKLQQLKDLGAKERRELNRVWSEIKLK